MVNSGKQSLFLLKIILLFFLATSVVGAGGENVWQLPNISDKALAEDLYKSGDYWGAINKLESYLLNHPKDSEARKLLAMSYLMVGKKAFDSGNFVEAIALFKKSIKYNASVPEVWYLLGVSLNNLNRKDKAISALEKVEKLQKGYKDTEKLLIKLYLSRGREEYRYGHYAKSTEYLEKILPLNPNNLEAHFYLGLDYYFLKKWKLSTSHLLKSAASKKFATYSNFYLGFINYQLGKYTNAVPFFLKSEAGDLKKKSIYYLSLCYYNIATAAYNQQDYVKAEDYYKKVLKLYPNHIDAHLGLALVFFKTGKYFRAANHLEIVKKLKGNYRNSYALLAEVYFRIGEKFLKNSKLKEAEKYFKLCYKNNVDRGDAYYNLAEIYFHWNNYNKAINFYNKAISKKYKVVDSTYKLGEIYFIVGDYKNAVKDLEEVYNWKKNYKNSVHYLWIAYKKLGNKAFSANDYVDSEFYFHKSLFYKPDQPSLRFKYAVSLYNNGKYKDSFEELTKLVASKNTKYKGFWSYLFRSSLKAGIAFFNNNDYENAVEMLKAHLRFFPSSVEGHYYLGLTYNRIKKFQDAIGELIQVVKKKPDYKNVNKELAYAYKEEGKIVFAKEDFNKSVKYFKNALIFNSKDIEARYFLGWSFLKLKKYWKAVVELEKVFRNKSDFKQVRKLLASAYSDIAEPIFKRGKYKSVVKIYKRLVTLYPNDPDFNIKYGLSLFYTDKFEDSLKYLRKAADLGADYVTCNYYIGEIYYIRKEYNKAYPYFMAVFQKKPGYKKVRDRYATVSFLLGKSYEKNNSLDMATEMFLTAYHLYPNNFKYLLSAARILKKVDDKKRSIKLYETLIKKYPWYYDAHLSLAELYLGVSEFKKALKLLLPDYKIKDKKFQKRRIRLLLRIYESYIAYLLNMEQYVTAIKEAKTALKFFPGDNKLKIFLIKGYIGTGKYKLAYRSALTLRGRNIYNDLYNIFLKIGKELIDQGNYKLGIDSLKRAYKIKKTGDSIFYLAYGYDKSGRLDLAYKYLVELFDNYPHYPFFSDLAREIINKKLNWFIKNGYLSRAEVFFNKAKQILPGFGVMYYIMGKAYYDRGEFNKAITYLKQCEGYEGKNFRSLSLLMADSYLQLAKRAYKKGKLADALNYLSISLKYSKENPEAYLLLSRLYKNQENILMAKDYFGRAILLNPHLVTAETVRKLGYSLGITNQTDWKKFLNEIGVRRWPSAVTH